MERKAEAKPSKKKKPESSSGWQPPLRWMIKSLLLILVVVAFVGGLIVLGRLGLEQVKQRDRYHVAFSAIICEPPPGLERSEFLGEVQYAGQFPEQISILDETLSARLSEAFAKHPWVEKVEEVKLDPPRRIEVRNTNRKPVLAVSWKGELRAIDGSGILLPRKASTSGLPVYQGKPKGPQGPAGTRWGDPELEDQARKLRSRPAG